MTCIVCSCIKTEVYLDVLVNLLVKNGSQRYTKVVSTTCVLVVHSVLTNSVHLFVSLIHLVPVKLSVLLTHCQVVVGSIPVIEVPLLVVASHSCPYVVGVTWHQLVVVRSRVVGIVIVQTSTFVHSILTQQRNSKFRGIVNLPVPRKHSRRSEVRDNS